MDLIYLLQLLKKRIIILIILPIMAAGITGTLTFLSPKVYKSEARIATGYTITNQHSLYEEGINQFKTDIKFNNLIEIIKSPIMMGVLSYQLLLHDLTKEKPFNEIKAKEPNEWFQEGKKISKDSIIIILKEKINNMELLSSFDEKEKTILSLSWSFGYSPVEIREKLRVKRLNYTDYISIQYESKDPLLSAYVINTLCDEFIKYNNSLNIAQSVESINFLDTLAQQKKAFLDKKSSELRAYKSRNNVLNFQLESESKIVQIKETEAEKERTMNNIRKIKLSISSLDERLDIENNENDEVVEIRNDLAKLMERKRKGLGDYSQVSDSIQMIRKELEILLNGSSNINQELLDERYDLQVDLNIEEEKLYSINSRLSQLQNEASSFATSEASITTLEQEVDIAKKEYLEVQEKLNAAMNSQIGTKNNIRVVVRAQPALEHQASGLIVKTGISFVGIFVLCIIAIIGAEFLDPRIKNIVRYPYFIELPLLATLFKELKNDQINNVENQSLKRLRHLLIKQGNKKILIASMNTKEGKSFLTITLAKSLASIGKNILIIDTNFRSSNQFLEITDPKAGNNIASTTNDQDKTSTDKNSVFKGKQLLNTTVGKICVITKNSISGSPSELFTSINFEKILEHSLQSEFDIVLMEGSSINEYSDALELSEYCDSAIIVIDSNSRFSKKEKANLELTNYLGGKIIGTVLNNLKK